MERDHTVHTFYKNGNEEIRITLRQYKERKYLDLRLWFQPPKGGDFRPTRKGITLGFEFLAELRRGLEQASHLGAKLAGQSTVTSVK